MYGPLFTATTMAEACAYVQSRFDINYMISLGAWGGYVVAGFDHSVDNSGGGVDLAIRGNPYSYQSEPGVVWVAQDENGDGEPNDTWYELAGSEYDSAETIYDYSVTYYQPTRAQAAVVWRDNRGGYDGQFCLFRLSNARTFDGRPADLKYIDFVKIQTGQMGKTALLGETSTEVHHIVDYHLIDRETE